MTGKQVVFSTRTFRSVTEQTAANDIFARAALSRNGIDALHMADGETPQAFVLRVYGELGTEAFSLLGAILIPDELSDLDWTREIASETTAYLRKLTAPKDKQIVQAQIVSLVMGFLRAELSLRMAAKAVSN